MSTHRIAISRPHSLERHLETDVGVTRFELNQSPLHGENFLPSGALGFRLFNIVWVEGFADNVAQQHPQLLDCGRIGLPDTFTCRPCGREGRYDPRGSDTDGDSNKAGVCNVPPISQVRPLRHGEGQSFSDCAVLVH
jgi:hypothetical protein